MAETKSRILYILKYLWHNTDAEHYATTGDILTYLKENGISCDRKTIPGDIAKLCDIGIDIEEERSRENRYSLSSHLFTLPEVKLLIDAVESSKFITAKKSSELANKLSQMTSVYQSEGLKRNIYISQRVKPRYIDNADAVMDLSYSMLEKHIADQEDIPDYTEEIKRMESEVERLNKKRINLIEMRADGDIDKDLFRERKQEIEGRIEKLTEDIKSLQPDEETQSPEDYMQKLQELRERLKQYTGFEYSVIPESIVEAFIQKIWVSKDEFRWYLRCGDNTSDEFNPDDHIKIASFTLTIDDAKKYLYSFSTRRRVYNWKDLNVSIWI